MFDKSKGAKPLYLQLAEIMESEILSDIYKPGDMLPKELDYIEKYNLSRITVRQAINELVLKGYVKRIRGKGTIILPPKIEEPLIRIKSFTDEMKDRGITPSTKSAKIVITKSFGEISKYLLQNDGDEAYKLTRIRTANNLPIVLFETYIKKNINMDLDNTIYYGSLYEYLDKNKGIKIKKVNQRISASIADSRLSQLLNIRVGEPILILKRQSFDTNNNVIEYTISYYIADRYEYYIEIENKEN
ncbi:GntR family transcriptional regulator [Clostridium sp. JN-9]|uniref:GntR family transcriptional regulator n=1 Tax=Clostridium sp. JN-9 TaxID=2507159 RepID=UPI000FFE07AC|nr:GntR family transcriptional regulator [Clostridium sp. JN-9]QAT39190.1 GntR family transcriptional regulator [Clostridium sp. JN-9]